MEAHKSYVRDWMTKQPIVVAPDTSAVEAYERMRDHNVHRLPVVESDGRLVGMITRGDIEGAVSFQRSEAGWHEARFALAGTVVEEVMTKQPVSVLADASMKEAVSILLQRHLSGLPVVEGDVLVGIISETDVYRLVLKLCED